MSKKQRRRRKAMQIKVFDKDGKEVTNTEPRTGRYAVFDCTGCNAVVHALVEPNQPLPLTHGEDCGRLVFREYLK